ncbi:rho GTPase-activating protein 100F isoform X2 [Strongylocentrotus purpuratus]|uniref:Rho GTPase-activating protein 100F n=1 Tax=Strongylocentrotus purpuratus TaxID=7668 RepID=A0A7M7PJ15_STRPU|nr:rho GTPase-activating protein 100F isoform X2 [Strongylocentrotus purpuratus]
MSDRNQGASSNSYEVTSNTKSAVKQTRSHSSSAEGIRTEIREMQIDGPAGFRHVGGITSDTVQAIQAAEREHFADLSRAEEFDNMTLVSHLDGRMNGGKPKIGVIQEREIQGGAFLLRTVEILKIPGETLGFYIREGDGFERLDGIFVSRLMLGGLVEDSGMIRVGDEILYVNNVDVSFKSLDDVYMVMQIPTRLLITLKSRQIGRSSYRHSSSQIHSARYDKSGSFPASPGRHSAALSSIIGLDPDRQSSPRSSSMLEAVKNEQDITAQYKLSRRVDDGGRVETRVSKTEYTSTQSAYCPQKEDFISSKSGKGDREPSRQRDIVMKRVLSRNRSATTGIIDDGPIPDPSLLPESQSEINLKHAPRLSRPGSFDPSIQTEEDSDSMVFVDEDFEESLSSSFQNMHGMRSSAPVQGSTSSHRHQQRPYSTIIPPDRSLLDDRDKDEGKVLLSVKSSDAVSKMRHSSSSDNIVASNWADDTKGAAVRKQPKSPNDPRMTRQRSNPDEQRASEMESSGGRSRKSGQSGRSTYLEMFSQQRLPALLRNVGPGRKISMASLAGKKSEQSTESLGDENSSKYVPKPSPDKKSRKISSSKQLDIDISQFIKIKGDVSARTRNRHLPSSGILALHLSGGRKMAPALASRNQLRDLYCVIEIDSVHKAQTATVTGRDEFCWDERFEIDLERAQDMGIMVYSYGWNPEGRQKLCHKSLIRLTQILIHAKSKDDTYNLAIRMEPRGILYISMAFTERHATLKRVPSLDRRGLFGVPLDVVVRREGSSRLIPILVQKCVHEIEVRGINVIGIYRVCGSAKKKKKLHDEFETASALVDLSYDNYPDINIITGVLKDYLRELPDPLMPPAMVERVMTVLAGASPDDPVCNGDDALSVMEVVGHYKQETVEYVLDHLKNVIVNSERNKMTPYNLAVCFGPVLMSSGKEDGRGGRGSRGATDVRADICRGDSREKSVDCAEKHIELLSCLLEVWPVRRGLETENSDNSTASKASEDKPSSDKPSSDEPVAPDNQEEDSCYHSNDDLNDGPAPPEGEARQKKESDSSEVNWDSENLEVSAC